MGKYGSQSVIYSTNLAVTDLTIFGLISVRSCLKTVDPVSPVSPESPVSTQWSPLSPVAHSPASGAYFLLGLEGIVILIIISFNFHLQRGEVFCSQSSLSEIVVITGELSALTDHTHSCRV